MERNEATCPICSQADHKLSCPHRVGGQLMLSANRDRTEAERLAQALEELQGVSLQVVSDVLLAAAAELRRLSADARMLDWLEADKGRRVIELGGRWCVRANFGQPHRRAATLRAAIDQAMDGK